MYHARISIFKIEARQKEKKKGKKSKKKKIQKSIRILTAATTEDVLKEIKNKKIKKK